MSNPWQPKRFRPEEHALEQRLRHLEARLAVLQPDFAGTGAAGGGGSTGRVAEADINFDSVSGHTHDGEDSAQIDGANILNAPWETLFGAWAKDDISLLGGTAEEIFNSFGKGANDKLPGVLPKAGTLTMLAVALDGDVGAAGNDLEVTVYLNGVATALTLTLSGGAGTEMKETATGSVAFAAEDEITVYARKAAGTLSARKAIVTVWGRFTG